MNSNIYEKNQIYDKYYDCEKNCIHPTPGKLFLKHTNSNITTHIINLTTPPLTQTFNQPIASVTIDTTSLCKQKFLINFVGILTTTSTTQIALTSTFTLFKICKESRIRQPVATYNFNVVDLIPPFSNSQTIMFNYSPCDDQCDGCCTYVLEFTRLSGNTFFPSLGSITINSKLSILGVDSSS